MAATQPPRTPRACPGGILAPTMKNLSGIPPIHCLAAFEAAARLGSFERAAEELAVSQSAVSHRVRTLEDQLDKRLFERIDRGVRLTAAGREYLEVVRAALKPLADYPGHRRGRAARARPLRVGVTPLFAREVVIPALGAFHDAHPGIALELVVSLPLQGVVAAEADIDIRFGSGDFADGEVSLLLNEPMFPVCAPAYARRLGLGDAPEELKRAVLLRCPFDPWKPWFEAAGLGWPEPESGPLYNDAGMMIEAALAAQGVALGTPRTSGRWLRSGALERLYAIEAPCPYSYYVVRRRKEAPHAEVFVAWLRGLVADKPLEPAAAKPSKGLRVVKR